MTSYNDSKIILCYVIAVKGSAVIISSQSSNRYLFFSHLRSSLFNFLDKDFIMSKRVLIRILPVHDRKLCYF